MDFHAPDLHARLEAVGPHAWDEIEFGIVAMNKAGDVTGYNARESKLAGLSRETVMGRHFFTEVAPCTNNYLVATRYEEQDDLDETIDYIFTVRMRARPVKLRMLKSKDSDTMYLAVLD